MPQRPIGVSDTAQGPTPAALISRPNADIVTGSWWPAPVYSILAKDVTQPTAPTGSDTADSNGTAFEVTIADSGAEWGTLTIWWYASMSAGASYTLRVKRGTTEIASTTSGSHAFVWKSLVVGTVDRETLANLRVRLELSIVDPDADTGMVRAMYAEVQPPNSVVRYRGRERSVVGETVVEQYLLELEDREIRHQRSISTQRNLGRALTNQTLFVLANHAGSGRIAALRRLTVQMDATAALTAVTPAVRLYRASIPASPGIQGGQVAPGQPFDMNQPAAQPTAAAYRQAAIDLGANYVIPMNDAVGATGPLATSSGATRTGRIVSGTPKFGVRGPFPEETALELPAGTNVVGWPDETGLRTTGGTFSWSCWVYVQTINSGTNPYIIYKSSDLATAAPTYGMKLLDNPSPVRPTGHILMATSATQLSALQASRSFPYGQWHHICVTRTSLNTTNRQDVYIDGVRDRVPGVALAADAFDNSGEIRFGTGAGVTIRVSNFAFFQGKELSAAQVFSLYRAGAPYIEARGDAVFDGYNGAGTASAPNDPLPTTLFTTGQSASARLLMRMHTAVEQVQMEDAVIHHETPDLLIPVYEGQMLGIRLEAAATTSNPATNHYLVNAGIEEFILP